MIFKFRVFSRVLETIFFLRNRDQQHRLSFCKEKRPRALFIDVSRVSAGYETGGIPRTVLEISREIVKTNCFSNVGFFRFGDRGEIVSAHQWAVKVLDDESFSLLEKIEFQSGDALLGLDLSLPPQYLSYKSLRSLREHGVRVYSMVYDLMPIEYPKLFKFGKSLLFWLWLRGVFSFSHVVAISKTVDSRLQTLSEDLSLGGKPKTSVVSLASFETKESVFSAPTQADLKGGILMVGTIEPRKGYLQALNVFGSLWSRGLHFRVTIVGRKGWKCARTLRKIAHLQAKGFPLHWFADASDDDLENFYSSHDVLVANSLAEGFGLPILEAARRGLHVIARDIEVFREVLPNAIFFSTSMELSETITDWVMGDMGASPTVNQHSRGENRSWQNVAEELCSLMGA